MKFKEELVEKVRSGELAIHNPTCEPTEQLRSLLKHCFPDDTYNDYPFIPYHASWWRKYFYLDTATWRSNSGTLLPYKSVNEFMEEFVLPEFWYVVVTKENISALAKWRFTSDYNDNWLEMGGVVGRVQNSKKSHDRKYYSLWKNEITFDQFKEHVLKENNVENKEIIGYKCPTDLFKETVKKGTIYTSKLSVLGQLYYPEYEQLHTAVNNQKGVATEIVETWEPVYKSKEVVITVNNTVINIKDNKMVAESKEFSIEWLRAIRELFNTRPSSEVSWATEVESVKIGCKTGWNKKHLDEIITAYNKLQEQK